MVRPHSLRFRTTLLSLAASAVLLSGCSGEGGLAPPAEVLAFAPAPPIIALEPEIPAAYPLIDPVGGADSLSILPEGVVSQPVVTGIGTDTPQLASAPAAPDVGPAFEPADRVPAVAAPRVDPQAEPKGAGRFAFLPRLGNPMSTPSWAGGLPAAEKACRQRLKRLGVTFKDIARVSSGPGCVIDYPVELTRLSGGITIKPAAKLNCQITEAFALWVKKELGPAARARYLSGINSINQLSSFSCRTMNSRRGAPMSEHSRGNAIDVGKITLNSGKEILVRQPGFFAFREKGLLNSVRADSCKYFTTVLGPGSDIHHKDHFHFDLRAHGNGYRHCD